MEKVKFIIGGKRIFLLYISMICKFKHYYLCRILPYALEIKHYITKNRVRWSHERVYDRFHANNEM